MNTHELYENVGRIEQRVFYMGRQSLPVGVTTMERLDLANFHNLLEHLRLTCPGWESNPGLRGGRRAL